MKSRFKFCLFLFYFFCQVSEAANYNIIGKLTGFNSAVKVYLLDRESENMLDSTILNKGSFHLTGRLENGPMYLSIEVNEGNNSYETFVFAGLGLVSIFGNKNDFPYHVTVNGGSEQNRYNAYINLLMPLNIEADAAWLAYTKANGDSKLQAGLAFNAIGNKKRSLEKKWIFSNKHTYFAANQIYDYLPEMTKDTAKTFYAELPGYLKNSIYGKRIYAYLTKGDTLKIKDPYLDFEAYDFFNKKIRLSSLMGKYILLDFSSVACGPCRESIEELRLLSKKYKAQLNILTYTLDKRSDWLQEIRDDNVTWISVIDPEGRYSKTQLKYNIQSIPTFYVISPNGIIADKWIGYEKTVGSPGNLEKHLINVGLAEK